MSLLNKNTTTSETSSIDGERSIPSINQGAAISKRLSMIFMVMCCLLILLFLGWRYFSGVAEKRRQIEAEATQIDTTTKAEQVLPALVVPKPPAPAPAPAPVAPPEVTRNTPEPAMYIPPPMPENKEPTLEELAEERKKLSPVAFPFEPPRNVSGRGKGDEEGFDQHSSDDELGRQMVATATPKANASVLRNRNFLLTKGTFIEAVMETAMSSDVPGMVKALVTSDVYSSNGRVVLLERGTHLVGEFKGQLRNGQARVFVLWTRAETPQGVVINLDSGTTDELGRSGMDGYVDHHWGLRLGSALLLSTWSDFMQVVAESQRNTKNGDNNYITYDNSSRASQDMASEALRQYINIPPTLYKNQGDPIRVFVARDLDFSSVYKLGVNDQAFTTTQPQLVYRDTPTVFPASSTPLVPCEYATAPMKARR